MYHFYDNLMFEVLIVILRLNENKIYNYGLLMVVNKIFNINYIYKYNFNLISIDSVQQIFKNDTTFGWVEMVFTNRIFFDNYVFYGEINYYDFNRINLSSYGYLKINNLKKTSLITINIIMFQVSLFTYQFQSELLSEMLS